MLKTFLRISIVMVIIISCHSNEEASQNKYSGLDQLLDSLTISGVIPGISLSVFNKDSILHEHYSGYLNIEDSILIKKNTLFEAASLSKPVFAHLYLKYFQNEIPVDTPLIKYYDFELTNNRNYIKNVTPFHVLSHQSGLPNWRAMPDTRASDLSSVFKETDSLNFKFEPGTRFSYSGEGYIWLQHAIEMVSGKQLEEIAQQKLFSDPKITRSSFIYSDAKNTATPYNGEMNPDSKQIIDIGLSPASLHSNANEYTLLFQRYLNDENSIFDPVISVDTLNSFQVKWCPGIGLMTDGKENYLFQWGDNGSFKAYVIYNTNRDLGVVYFVNSSEGLKIRNLITDTIFENSPPMWPDDYKQLK